jgi:hypothetical protein
LDFDMPDANRAHHGTQFQITRWSMLVVCAALATSFASAALAQSSSSSGDRHVITHSTDKTGTYQSHSSPSPRTADDDRGSANPTAGCADRGGSEVIVTTDKGTTHQSTPSTRVCSPPESARVRRPTTQEQALDSAVQSAVSTSAQAPATSLPTARSAAGGAARTATSSARAERHPVWPARLVLVTAVLAIAMPLGGLVHRRRVRASALAMEDTSRLPVTGPVPTVRQEGADPIGYAMTVWIPVPVRTASKLMA